MINKVKYILSLLLAYGNHMNSGSHAGQGQGQAYGFEIDSLSMLPAMNYMRNILIFCV